MNQGCRGIAAKRERHQEQHLHALREIRIEAMIIPVEAVVLPDPQDIPQMIAAAIGADFRRHCIKEVAEGECRKYKNKENI